mmetsp:Transcript_14074/g.18235  ORF Transcript_14074/g.18235 Transcript_14074/m.18235 type:complete len:150 (-) Transcript_14074:474-923(-)|eukprot:CAMPEP_0204870208 /NCGR_PEP_ID=MMETSP1348-20121228/31821_1 /ASSEMBLY_ACC=CAM_ASM_000700 /TAXON_ID=215587 /ORGANISM="Aplanochytrium stocchinoi, Strain GSBS06" /LENGTH=149 /DNA_ID=CAMNT_0052023903 /DNA_START=130 /DNA_END=579 /DNA_ORIENTATION=-
MQLTLKKLKDWQAIYATFEDKKEKKMKIEDIPEFARRAYPENPPTEEEVKLLVQMYDSKKGFLSFEDICDLMISHAPMKELMGTFQAFDRDKSGTVDSDEIKFVFEALGIELSQQMAEDMIKMFDTDGNGELDFKEFQALYKQLGMHKI